MKKIIAVVGSPRKGGNTDILMQEVLAAAEKAGAETKSYHLQDLKMSGCVACYSCKKQEGCVIRDDISPILNEIATADGVVFGTPIYKAQMSAQLKMMFDRLFVFRNPDASTKLKPGKKLVFVVSQARPDENMYSTYLQMTGKAFDEIGFEHKTLVVGGNHEKAIVVQNEQALDKARKLGEWLVAK